jgi:hypothetical protein
MNKKIILLSLAACAALLALPAMASALTALHVVNPVPVGTKTIDGVGNTAILTTTGGTKVTCTGEAGGPAFGGTATFNAGGTTGTMNLTFGPTCEALGIHCQSAGAATGTIKTESLPFDLATVGTTSPGKPGVLVTPNAGTGVFAKFTCGILSVEVKGNGVIGTISSPTCGTRSNQATIEFKATANGVQADKRLVGTETEYTLKKGTENAAQEATGTLTLGEESTLECT